MSENEQNNMEEQMREILEKVLPEKVAETVEKIVRDRGIEISQEPKTVVRPEPIFNQGKIGGKVTIEVKF